MDKYPCPTCQKNHIYPVNCVYCDCQELPEDDVNARYVRTCLFCGADLPEANVSRWMPTEDEWGMHLRVCSGYVACLLTKRRLYRDK